ncbi:MAG: c-type cytochrome [Nitrospinae bacterium]|nr:c-type cytochrome [Nitrospinota bacterium]
MFEKRKAQGMALILISALLLIGWGGLDWAASEMGGWPEGSINPLHHPSQEAVQELIQRTGLKEINLDRARELLVERYREEGQVLYQLNCRPCHGVGGKGDGPMSQAFRPGPVDLTAPETLARIKEPTVFERLAGGAMGASTGVSPSDAVLHVWEKELGKEGIWKVLLALEELAHPGASKEGQGGEGKVPATREARAAGKDVYAKRCRFCHGPEGKGDGPVADYLNPRPRDFTRGLFKFRTTGSGELPTDEDLFQTISQGVSGTSMPAWKGLLTERERWEVIQYLKSFALAFSDPDSDPYQAVVPMSHPIPSTPDSLAKGKEIFQMMECWQCHGKGGKGNGANAATLKDEWEFPILPANLTKGWQYKGGHNAQEIYLRFTTGLNGTPMPSYADSLTVEERWHLVNYVTSLIRPERGEERVLRPKRVEGSLPLDPNDPRWQQAPALNIPLGGQAFVRPRWQNPSVDQVEMRALDNGQEIGFRLEWDDRFKDVLPAEGEGKEDGLLDGTYARPLASKGKKPKALHDAVALQFPVMVGRGKERPPFFRGDPRRPVNLWIWRADRQEDLQRGLSIEEVNQAGPDSPLSPQPPASQSVRGKGVWEDGTWKVVLLRSHKTGESDLDVQFEPGGTIPLALNVWDGSNGEAGLMMSISSWAEIKLGIRD